MKVHPYVVATYLFGIILNSIGRLVLLPLKYPFGIALTTYGYIIWASTYAYICIRAITSKQFNKHLAFWLVFTILAPIQFNAARAQKDTLNQITGTILWGMLAVGTIIEARYYLQRRSKQK